MTLADARRRVASIDGILKGRPRMHTPANSKTASLPSGVRSRATARFARATTGLTVRQRRKRLARCLKGRSLQLRAVDALAIAAGVKVPHCQLAAHSGYDVVPLIK